MSQTFLDYCNVNILLHHLFRTDIKAPDLGLVLLGRREWFYERLLWYTAARILRFNTMKRQS